MNGCRGRSEANKQSPWAKREKSLEMFQTGNGTLQQLESENQSPRFAPSCHLATWNRWGWRRWNLARCHNMEEPLSCRGITEMPVVAGFRNSEVQPAMPGKTRSIAPGQLSGLFVSGTNSHMHGVLSACGPHGALETRT